jgi:hypothetical protein
MPNHLTNTRMTAPNPTTAPSRAIKKKKHSQGVILTDEEFARLFEYLDREHTITWDPDFVGLTTKIGKKLWGRVQVIGAERGLTPQHKVDLSRLG